MLLFSVGSNAESGTYDCKFLLGQKEKCRPASLSIQKGQRILYIGNGRSSDQINKRQKFQMIHSCRINHAVAGISLIENANGPTHIEYFHRRISLFSYRDFWWHIGFWSEVDRIFKKKSCVFANPITEFLKITFSKALMSNIWLILFKTFLFICR